MDVFDWGLSYGLSIPRNPRVSKISFGDNYEQVVPIAITPDLKTFTAQTAELDVGSAQVVEAFLASHAGETFALLMPEPYNGYICVRTDKWVINEVSGGIYTFNIDFVQVFDTPPALPSGDTLRILMTDDEEGITDDLGDGIGL